MQRMLSTRFRLLFLDLTEPVEVTRLGEPVGTWLPDGIEFTINASGRGAAPRERIPAAETPAHPRAATADPASVRASGGPGQSQPSAKAAQPPTTPQERPERTSQPELGEIPYSGPSFNSVPFTPVPKGAKR